MNPIKRPLRNPLLLAAPAILWAACGNHPGAADAYGNFETVETTVSAQGTGNLLRFDVEEGVHLPAGREVGLIDTVPASLQLQEAVANRKAILVQHGDIAAELAVQQARLTDLQREEKRLEKLVAGKAATAKQLDEMRGQIAIQRSRMEAVTAKNPAISAKVLAMDAKVDLLRQQLADLHIINPMAGVVTVTTAEPHEFASPGRPLYRIAQMDTLDLRAFMDGAHLADLMIGAHVEVGIDRGDSGIVRLPGRISWLSSEAEFTPKTIQTREERVDMMYAFKVRVPNHNGLLKNGMPGEVYLMRPDGRSTKRAKNVQ